MKCNPTAGNSLERGGIYKISCWPDLVPVLVLVALVNSKISRHDRLSSHTFRFCRIRHLRIKFRFKDATFYFVPVSAWFYV